MKNVNWDMVQDDVRRPVPGGYAARITRVEDNEEKEYLLIEWEFADGEFKGSNKETMDRLGFWPMPFFCSYKEKALRFFKGFKTSVECSNPGYVFKNNPQSLVGKFVGVVLGEEEYIGNDGKKKTRPYVAEKRSGKAIRDGDFKVPELKKLPASSNPDPSYGGYATQAAAYGSNFSAMENDDEQLPF